MALPTLEQYNEAAQNPASSFFDPELQRGRVKTSGLGIPLAACGGFALTYTITNGQNKYAVRCFHKEARDREIRYEAISRKLSALKSGYFVGFQFQKRGIKVKGQPWPIVKMAWAQGETIGEFVDANFQKRDVMLALKQSILDLASFLERNRISHGDIQPGNLMVSNGGKNVQLIDYDGMYLPEISNLTSEETGHRNFQHPDRVRLNPWNERSDRFSFILLSIAFDALSHNPQLWINSRSDGDKFLIGANDFVAPASSKIFSEISAIPGLKDGMSRFSSICLGGYDAIPSLTDYLNSSFQISVSSAFPSRKVGYISTYPVLDAKDYDLCLKHVGDMVELVGQVVDVWFSITKWGKPYCFLNFADWRGNAVKINIWSNYLDKAKGIDFKRLKGKYISVIGLMQPPYHGKSKYHEYTHLSISLDTTVNEIDEREARYRLDYEKAPFLQREQTNEGAAVQGRSNRDIFNDIRNSSSSRRQYTGAHPTPAHAKSTSNATSGKKDFFVPCPHCTTRNRVGTSGVETVTCSSCQAVFEYSHYTQKTRLTSCPAAVHGRSNRVIFDDIKGRRQTPEVSSVQSPAPGSSGQKKSNRDIFKDIRNTASTATQSRGAHPTQAHAKSASNATSGKKDFFVPCPHCTTRNRVGTSGVETVTCSSCGTVFEYSHYTRKTCVKSSTPHGGTSPQKDTWERCPYCFAYNNVGSTGIVRVLCKNCNEVFEYSHFTKQSGKLGSTSPSSSSGTCDVQVPCPYCGNFAKVGQSGVVKISCPVCKGEFRYSHYTKSITETNSSGSRLSNEANLQSMKKGSVQASERQQKTNIAVWIWVLSGIAFLGYLFLLLK